MSRNTPSTNETPTIRCAIYTRKSTEEGLDQDFNTLDAQRESAEAYIKSQKHEGWEVAPESYDDGGYSGGNLERPAFKRLFADIEAGKINCVVVYKVDRLSRSLLDFARIMAVFDRHKVAFVSVTQQFNTATSMGRLVLNVLLSFAQFEREIIGERIRDKIAAQRRKGKWGGGTPVLGYDVDRSNPSPKLAVNPHEAKQVVAIFELYLKLGSVLPVVRELEARGWINKVWKTKKGTPRGGKPYDKSSVYGMLTNSIYVGRIKHKGADYAGEHPPIVDAELFERVQNLLKRNGRAGVATTRKGNGTLLKGLLCCQACGRIMVHTFTNRGVKRYRYYTCTHAIHRGRDKCPSGSLPASEVEQLVVRQVRTIAADAGIRSEVLNQARTHIEEETTLLEQEQKDLQRELKSHQAAMSRVASAKNQNEASAARTTELMEWIGRGETRLVEIRKRLTDIAAEKITAEEVDRAFADFESLWNTLSPGEQHELLALLVARVAFDVHKGTLAITFHSAGIKSLANGSQESAA